MGRQEELIGRSRAVKPGWKTKLAAGILIAHLGWVAPPAAPAQQTDETVPIELRLENADLLQVVGIIAEQLEMNYVVDPRVEGTVIINTLGELQRSDLFPLLQTILRINGATAVQTGNLYHIVPLEGVQRLPIAPQLNPQSASLSEDDRVVMNVITLRYVSAPDMTRILEPYVSEGGHLVSHDAGNVLIITDTSRSMQRIVEIVALFDTDVFTDQRARLYPIQHSNALQIAAELEQVFSAYALSAESSAIRFVAMERINSLLVVTANAGVYAEVEEWLERLDQPVQDAGVQTFIYRVENGAAENLSSVLNQLLGVPTFFQGMGQGMGQGAFQQGAGGAPGTMQQAAPGMQSLQTMPAAAQTGTQTGAMVAAAPGTGAPSLGLLTGAAPGLAGEMYLTHLRIVPDVINNLLVIQATAQEYERIRQMLRDLDVVPRQVMIEAKVYEVDLIGDLSAGVTAFLQRRTAGGLLARGTGQFGPPSAGSAPLLTASMGTLVGKMRELLIFLNAAESRSEARVISAPSILASDNLAASISVGTEIPMLSSQVFGLGAQSADNPVFTNAIQNRDTGVLLTITPRVNSSGLVTLQISQEVSAPVAPLAGAAIQSPSISKRTVSTQAVVQDGETIALGGIIQEDRTYSRNRIPLLGDIPYVGALFGSTSLTTSRTELILLLTPTVIRDTSEARIATAEFRSKLRDLTRIIEEEEEREQERREREAEEREQEAEQQQDAPAPE